jgi:hypothetical protein
LSGQPAAIPLRLHSGFFQSYNDTASEQKFRRYSGTLLPLNLLLTTVGTNEKRKVFGGALEAAAGCSHVDKQDGKTGIWLSLADVS